MGYKLKRILIHPGGVEKQVRPSVWKPGANTVAYYPLDINFNDQSGNGYNLSNSGTIISSIGGVSCAYFNGSAYLSTSILTLPQGANNRAISYWIYIPTLSSMFHFDYGTRSAGEELLIGSNANGNITYYTAAEIGGYTSAISGNSRYNIVITNNGQFSLSLYINGVKEDISLDQSWGLQTNGTTFYIGSGIYSTSNRLTGYLSEFIIENKMWTQDDVSNYYNITKGNYGL